MALVYPPKVCITIVFDAIFFWGGGGGGGGGWGKEKTRCIMVYVKLGN